MKQTNHGEMLRSMDRVLLRELTPLLKESGTALAEQRCRKFPRMKWADITPNWQKHPEV